MIVRDVLVVERRLFEESLIKELILLGVSYVQVDNEIHFDNYIYRFYELNMVIEEKFLECLSEQINDYILSIKSTNHELCNSRTSVNTNKRYTKKKIRQDSHLINRKLKSSLL